MPGTSSTFGCQLQHPLQCNLGWDDTEAGGRTDDQQASEHRGGAAVGEVEQVLHADDGGALRGVPELFEGDVAQADTGDQSLVAGPDCGQLIIEGRVDPAVAGQTKVDRDQLADPQAAEIVFHALAQLVWIVVRDDGARVVPADRDLADEPCRTAGTFSAGLRSRWEDRLRD